MPDPIDALPTPPSRNDAPATFISRANAFIAALVNFVTQVNVVAAAFNFNSTSGTSSTSNSIGNVGDQRTFEADTGKSWLPSMYLVIGDTAAPTTNSMTVQVDSYNSGTGELVVTIKGTEGSGTKTAWTISQTANPVPLDNSVSTASLQDDAVTNAKLAFDGGAFTFRNRLINPFGEIYQRAVAATADDAYFADRWYILSQTGAVTPSKLSDPEDGYSAGIRITQSQASAQRFGFAQIIEGKNCKDIRGGSVVMVPRIRASASQAIRYAILAWTGTEDSVTSDVVADWTSASYTAGGFFNSTTLSVVAVGTQTPSANAWTSLDAITDAAGSTFNNLIVMVWTEGTAAQNFTLDFDYVQLEKGASFTAFEKRAFQQELDLCQRYYEKSYNNGDEPGTTTANGYVTERNSVTGGSLLTGLNSKLFPKRTTPTITWYSQSTGLAARIWNITAGADVTVSSTSGVGQKNTGFPNTSTSLTDTHVFAAHFTADAEI